MREEIEWILCPETHRIYGAKEENLTMEIKDAIVTDHPFPNAFSPEMLLLDHGSGCRLTDAAGKSYLDLGAGIAVNALGYGREDLVDIVAAQSKCPQ